MSKLDDVLAEAEAELQPIEEGTKDADTTAQSDGISADAEEKTDETNAETTPDTGTDDAATAGTETPEDQFVEETLPLTQDLPADVKTFVDEKLQDIEVWGREGVEGKLQKFTVKSAYDLPDDFVPRSYKDQQVQAQQFAKQDRMISKYEDEFVEVQASNARAETKRQLEASWSVELQAAQAEGRIPKVTKEKPGDPGFDKAAEVIEYMKVQNDNLAKVNAPYRIQSFTQALDLYEANQLKTETTTKQSSEEALQSKKGSMVGGGRSTKDDFSQVPKAGTKLDDLLASYN